MKSIDPLIECFKQVKDELTKAIKPGPALNYGKINPAANPLSNPAAAHDAKVANYNQIEAKAPTINYNENRMSKPTWSGAAGKAKTVQAKLDAESKETGLQTIQRRAAAATKKSDGNVGDETMKNDSMGGGFAMSEKEPHDDPKHEHKEVAIGKKVKEEAQDLINMHKDESCIKGHANGQWFLGEPVKKADFGTHPHKDQVVPKNGANLDKADKESHSVFNMQHSHDVAKVSHPEGKKLLHDIVDASKAAPENKAKIKAAIEGTKNSRGLSGLVANHVLAAGGNGHKPGSLKVL